MKPENSIEIVTEALGICAENLGDIVPAVYERFFAFSEEASQVMDHADQHMQGRMFEEVVGLLISEEPFEAEGYLDWELKNHLDAYGATPPMYEAFFQAVMVVVKEGVGSTWADRYSASWNQRVDCIMKRVYAHS